MKIHFICLGNNFRSRLADAYLKSLGFSETEVSSSGVIASEANTELICWYTKEVLEKENLLSFGKESWAQTNPDVVLDQDLLIFMHPSVYAIYEKKWGDPVMPFEVWDIEDAEVDWDSLDRRNANEKERSMVLDGIYERYWLIVRRVNDLVKGLQL